MRPGVSMGASQRVKCTMRGIWRACCHADIEMRDCHQRKLGSRVGPSCSGPPPTECSMAPHWANNRTAIASVGYRWHAISVLVQRVTESRALALHQSRRRWTKSAPAILALVSVDQRGSSRMMTTVDGQPRREGFSYSNPQPASQPRFGQRALEEGIEANPRRAWQTASSSQDGGKLHVNDQKARGHVVWCQC